MSSFLPTIDLLSLAGSQYVNGKSRPRRQGESEESYARVPIVPGVFIPVDPNDITVSPDQSAAEYRNPSSAHAYLHAYAKPLRRDSPLVKSQSDRLIAQGETPDEYNVSSHEIQLQIRKEKKDAMVEKYRLAIVAQHPEWKDLDFYAKDSYGKYINKEYRAAVYRYIPNSIGTMRTVKPQQMTPTATANFTTATLPAEVAASIQIPSAPVAPQAAVPQEIAPVDDLPF